MSIKFLLLLLGVLVFPSAVSAAAGYCSSTTEIQLIVQIGDYVYIYVVHYPAYKGSTDCLMNTGATGAGVKSLQSSLNNCYKQSLEVDGIYGANTKAAVKVAQRAEGTSPDGVFGPVTGGLISWYTASIDGGPNLCISNVLEG